MKPSNILITGREFAYLIDFRLARTAGEVGMTIISNAHVDSSEPALEYGEDEQLRPFRYPV